MPFTHFVSLVVLLSLFTVVTITHPEHTVPAVGLLCLGILGVSYAWIGGKTPF